jgi:hypothetical protein
MGNIIKFENFTDKFYIIGFGLGGGFGGIHNYEVIKASTKDEASTEAWKRACDEYEQYSGMHGLRTIEDIMDEDGLEDESEAEDVYNEERESWLDYEVLDFNLKNLKKISGYHFNNPYSNETDKLL